MADPPRPGDEGLAPDRSGHRRIACVVLAGGTSRRMGFDKAGALLRGRTLIERACGRLAPQCATVAVSRRDGLALDALPGVAVLADAEGAQGPLAGVLAALDWGAGLSGAGVAHVATVAVDTPFLPHDLVARLAERWDAGSCAVVCAATGGRAHPVAALWPVALRHDLRRLVVEGHVRRVTTAIEAFGYATVAWTADAYDPFFNVNAPEDLVRAETIAATLEGGAAAGEAQ